MRGSNAHARNTNHQGGRRVNSSRLRRAPVGKPKLPPGLERIVADFDHFFAEFPRMAGLRDLPQQRFGCTDVAIPPALDEVLMRPFRDLLFSMDSDLDQALHQRSLLTIPLQSALDMMKFLSAYLPAARAAQVDSVNYLPSPLCVPASFLIADAYELSAPARFPVERNDLFETGKTYRSLAEAFIARARELSAMAGFRNVMASANDPVSYVKAIALCEIWDTQERCDRLDRIYQYHLLDIDLLKSEW